MRLIPPLHIIFLCKHFNNLESRSCPIQKQKPTNICLTKPKPKRNSIKPPNTPIELKIPLTKSKLTVSNQRAGEGYLVT